MELLGVFLGALWGWIKCDMVWPSVLAFIFLGFSEYTPSVATAITSALSNGIVQLILWLFIFAAILTVSGISEQLANRLVAAKLTRGRPWLLSIVIIAACYLCSMLGAAFAGIFICWEFVYMVSKQVGYTKNDTWPKMMIVAIAFSSCIGMVVLPFIVGVVASYGYLASASAGLYGTYDYHQYLIFSLIFGTVIMAIYFLLCKLIVRPDMSKLKQDVDVGNIAPYTKRQKIAIGALVALLVLTILPSILPASLKAFFNTIGTSAFVLAICAFVTVFRDKEGKPYFTFQELANKGLYWNMMFMIATAITLGTALATGDTGFNATFVKLFTPLFAGKSPYFFALIICIATMILTNLVNNAVAGAIMVPLMYSFSANIGVNPLMLTALIVFVSDVGLLLPCSSPTGALLAGNKEWLNPKDVVFQSSIAILATLLAVAIIGIPLGNLIFK